MWILEHLLREVINKTMSRAFLTKFDLYKEEKENDEKFSKIPDDLIIEYLDLHQEKSQLVRQHQMEVDNLIKEHEKKKKLILLSLDANYKKMVAMSKLNDVDLSKRLPPKRDTEPSN